VSAGYEVCISHMGRPLLANQAHQMHHRTLAPIRKGYRDGAATLARAQKIPHHERVTVTAHAEYPTRRSLPDADAIAPSVKSILDGLVDAGVLDDDGPAYVTAVTYEAPRVVAGCTPAVVVRIDAAPPVRITEDER
jgi:hypothetical protein